MIRIWAAATTTTTTKTTNEKKKRKTKRFLYTTDNTDHVTSHLDEKYEHKKKTPQFDGTINVNI